MPRNSKNVGKKPAGQMFDYVPLSLSKNDKAEFMVWLQANTQPIPDLLHHLVTEGYKVSLSGDLTHDAFVASLSINDKDHMNYGLIMTGRGPDLSGALHMVAYKHWVMTDCDWRTVAPRPSTEDPWA